MSDNGAFRQIITLFVQKMRRRRVVASAADTTHGADSIIKLMKNLYLDWTSRDIYIAWPFTCQIIVVILASCRIIMG